MRPAVLVVAAAVLACLACGGGSGEDATVAPATTGANELAPDRQPAPAIEGTSLDGEPISLADYRGRPVLINVWSSW